ncbi:MAG: GtrA family protein [Propionibacteriaceae bacterium]|jgi:putative flippase GtrA|nr:GtrA family protein [Propionibacteriaceae bacterium]
MGIKTQAWRFVIVGLVSGVVDFGILWLLMAFGVNHDIAKGVSYIFGTLSAYMLNRRWTFEAGPSKRRFAAVAVLYAAAFALNVGVFALLYPWLEAILPWRVAAQFLGFAFSQILPTLLNFFVQRWVIFKNA